MYLARKYYLYVSRLETRQPDYMVPQGQAMYRSQERSPENTRDGFARSHLFGLYPSSLSKSAGFISLAGKASLVSISAAILFLRS